MTLEEWRDIAGYEGKYQVSNLGNVKSLQRKERLLKPASNGSYLFVVLSKGGESKMHYVHRLVAQAFIPNAMNKCDVNHLNCVKTDNRAENLEWATRRENLVHAHANGLLKPPKRKILQFDLSGNLLREWESIAFAARSLNKVSTNIRKCCCGDRYKTAYGYIWKYKDVSV